jgi:hypothetical protein
VRVGVTTGEAMITLPAGGHPGAIGDVINTAARLEAAAPTDGVLVDAWTYRATRRAIDFRQHGPIAAKGKTDPVEAWIAHAPRSIIPEQQRDQLPIVGRDTETACGTTSAHTESPARRPGASHDRSYRGNQSAIGISRTSALRLCPPSDASSLTTLPPSTRALQVGVVLVDG